MIFRFGTAVRVGLWSRLKGLVSERVVFKMTEIRPDCAYYILLSKLNQMMQEGLLYRQTNLAGTGIWGAGLKRSASDGSINKMDYARP